MTRRRGKGRRRAGETEYVGLDVGSGGMWTRVKVWRKAWEESEVPDWDVEGR